ncbi:hypothetical protein ACRS3Y_03240 [Staphylococcus epidermidis]|uniref:hypothetical protein n=1 Tax=Staphylococcus epidermidis TaxID=1282 RepID=UPI0034D3ED36
MKKLLGTLFAATLVLSACSQDDTKEDENKKSESTTEKKADDKKDKKTKEDKKSKEEKKSQENEDNESTQEDNSTEEQDTQETATNEQAQSQQQTQEPATQEQQTQQANQQNYNDQQSYHEPTKDEIYEWDKQNIPGGTDYGLIDPEDVNEPSDSQNEEPDEWIKGQEEWANATQSEKEEIRKRDAEKYGYEYDPSDYEE